MEPMSSSEDIDYTLKIDDNRSMPDNSNKEFGQALRQVRQWKGLTQKELADHLECHITTVSMFERGRLPHKATVDNLVDLFSEELSRFGLDLYEIGGFYSHEQIKQREDLSKSMKEIRLDLKKLRDEVRQLKNES